MRQLKLLLMVLVVLFAAATYGFAQNKVAIKTNLLYGGLAQTPNLGLEIGLSQRTTIDILGGYNWFNRKGKPGNNKKLAHRLAQLEFRYYLAETFNGHYFGVHATAMDYNIGNKKVPLFLESGSKQYRYEGAAYGAGISYGYVMILSVRWNLEFNLGFGYLSQKYDKWEHPRCGKLLATNVRRHYFGPTKLGITLSFLLW